MCECLLLHVDRRTWPCRPPNPSHKEGLPAPPRPGRSRTLHWGSCRPQAPCWCLVRPQWRSCCPHRSPSRWTRSLTRPGPAPRPSHRCWRTGADRGAIRAAAQLGWFVCGTPPLPPPPPCALLPCTPARLPCAPTAHTLRLPAAAESWPPPLQPSTGTARLARRQWCSPAGAPMPRYLCLPPCWASTSGSTSTPQPSWGSSKAWRAWRGPVREACRLAGQAGLPMLRAATGSAAACPAAVLSRLLRWLACRSSPPHHLHTADAAAPQGPPSFRWLLETATLARR